MPRPVMILLVGQREMQMKMQLYEKHAPICKCFISNYLCRESSQRFVRIVFRILVHKRLVSMQRINNNPRNIGGKKCTFATLLALKIFSNTFRVLNLCLILLRLMQLSILVKRSVFRAGRCDRFQTGHQ